ncbi:hypothetical protein QQM39_34410 [Streptomyces sp. DT2A-34]|uniref:hypothetical protein n=1 Tax=Streptomyces sp. DT2A-34 TaxID=3051182 RepID=UPI00265C2A48|nr:hypothetical protein [Streptomyces sp. DT2A-34]MDO0915736.1 hypothetical protein [Streptomyces sp. DT2A-34]
MTTGGARRQGAALALALPAVGPAAGCGGQPGAQGDVPETRASANSPSPAATSPAQLCTRIIGYWSRRALTGATYGDHQSMGLSDGQYEILRKVVDAARAERERAGARAADRLIDRRAQESCEERYRKGEPTGGPWG